MGGLTSYTGDREPYYKALQEITTTCPETEVAEYAASILQQLGISLGGSEVIVEEKEPESSFVENLDKSHYFAILIPVEASNGESEKAKTSDFNKEYFNSQKLRITSNLLNRTHQMILVNHFLIKRRRWTTTQSTPGIERYYRCEFKWIQYVCNQQL